MNLEDKASCREIYFDDIRYINNFRHDPHKYKMSKDWKRSSYKQIENAEDYINSPPLVYNWFSQVIISDGTKFGFKVVDNFRPENKAVFCNVNYLNECYKSGLLRSLGGNDKKLFIAGNDQHLKNHVKVLQRLVENYSSIYYEAKNGPCDFVKAFPMGGIMAYLLSNGGNDILPYINERKEKSKLVAASFGYRYPKLTKSIDQRNLLDAFLKQPTNNYIDNFSCQPARYYKTLSDYKFFICPIGNGIQTPKLQECLLTFTIPVVKKHAVYEDLLEWGLPLLVVEHWRDISEHMLNSYYENNYCNIDWTKVRSLFHTASFKDIYFS